MLDSAMPFENHSLKTVCVELAKNVTHRSGNVATSAESLVVETPPVLENSEHFPIDFYIIKLVLIHS
jgi:hypothetical protein